MTKDNWRDTPLKDNKPVNIDEAIIDILLKYVDTELTTMDALDEIKELFKENK